MIVDADRLGIGLGPIAQEVLEHRASVLDHPLTMVPAEAAF